MKIKNIILFSLLFLPLLIFADDKKYYIAIYSHKNYVFSYLYNDKSYDSKYHCLNINKLKNYTIYGYGFPEFLKLNFVKIKPSSENIGIVSLKKINSFKDKSIDNINPIYLLMEK